MADAYVVKQILVGVGAVGIAVCVARILAKEDFMDGVSPNETNGGGNSMNESSWWVWCKTCGEPVGLPFWANGCACDGDLNDYQLRLLDVINDGWRSMTWEDDSIQ